METVLEGGASHFLKGVFKSLRFHPASVNQRARGSLNWKLFADFGHSTYSDYINVLKEAEVPFIPIDKDSDSHQYALNKGVSCAWSLIAPKENLPALEILRKGLLDSLSRNLDGLLLRELYHHRRLIDSSYQRESNANYRQISLAPDALKEALQVLGFKSLPTKAELRKRWLQLSMKFHPDKNLGDKEKEEEFKKISGGNDLILEKLGK